MINRLHIILVFIFMVKTGICQLQVDWQQCYCSLDADQANDIVQLEDGFLVIGMQTGGDGQVVCSNTSGAWLLKITNTGEVQWQKCYQKGAYLMFREFEGSNNFIIGAAMMDPYPNEANLWITKTDTLGEIIWERALGNEDGVSSYHFYGNKTNDGGVIASVDIFSQGGDITTWYGGYDGWVVKLDSLGNTDWDFTIGSERTEVAIGIMQTLDDGFLVCGAGTPDGVTGNISTASYDPTYGDAIIYKLDSLGNPEWNRTYGGSDSDLAIRAVSVADGYLIAGGTRSDDGFLDGSGWHEGYHHTGDPTSDIWLIWTDLYGEIIWDKCYGGSNTEGVSRIFSTQDGGFVVFGVTDSHDGDISYNPANGNDKSIWVFKVNSQGQLLWEQCIGGGATERVHGVIQHSDNNYTLAGEMFYSPSGDVNCSNFILGSSYNYWVLGISDTTVGINDIRPVRAKINIYPNPTNEILNIDFPNNFNLKKTSIKLLDINSRITIDFEPLSYNNKFSMSKLKPGLYILKIHSDKSYIIEKVLIQ